ncbi:MAG: chloride channel protein [Oscillospiraceae bacterium]|nr:chloride channel protein [Oscillospiraceae bacterium]
MGEYIAVLVKWVAIGFVVGVLGGGVGAFFHIGVERATELRMAHPQVLWLLPVAGVVIVALYRALRLEGEGTNKIIESVHFGKNVPVLLVPLIFVATCLTHLVGGSAGREGAALQIGGGIGYQTGRLMHLDEKDLPLTTQCGMAALFAALFGTPLTAAIFALEVISVGVIYYAGLIPCITAAAVGYGVAKVMGVAPTRYAILAPAVDTAMMVRVLFLAVACAVVSIIFVRGMHWIEHGAKKFISGSYRRAIFGGLLLLILSHSFGTDFNGAGMDVIARALEGGAEPWAWLIKILFTAVTIGFGFKGGEVVPSFFVGATFGCVLAPLLAIPAPFGAAIGLVAVFCGAVNCPVASVILSIELFGAEGLLFFAAACAVSYLMSGYSGLYTSQIIMYSKKRAQFINVHTKE